MKGRVCKEELISMTAVEPDDSLREYFRYPAGQVEIESPKERGQTGFFRFGAASCYGRCAVPYLTERLVQHEAPIVDVATSAAIDSGKVYLPFDLGEVADNLRQERYVGQIGWEGRQALGSPLARNAYYLIRRFLPVAVRKHLQKARLADWKDVPFPSWPVDCSTDLLFEEVLAYALQATDLRSIPFVWFWPDSHFGCILLTHDVEEAQGRDFCGPLMDIDESFGFRSAFQIVPEQRYQVTPQFIEGIWRRGHEVNVHDLNHDGRLYHDRDEFLRRAEKINKYCKQFGSSGFRSGILYRNLDWYDAFQFCYDMSVPNVGHLDPQRGGCCTVMPYFIGDILELPLTTTQDYSLFHILNDRSGALWEAQIEAITERHGLLCFNIHPDYIIERAERSLYLDLLARLADHAQRRRLWMALPGEIDRWWRQRSKMEIVKQDGGWCITGEGSERARIGWASLRNGKLVLSVEQS